MSNKETRLCRHSLIVDGEAMRNLILLFILAGCTTNTITGAFTGGLLGGGIGFLADSSKGGVIASAAGLALGSIVGTVLDAQDRLVIQKNSPRTLDRMDRNDPLTINDVIKLSQNGISDDAILHYLRETLSFYALTQIQIRRLQDSGVSQRVIHAMLELGR